MTEKADRPYRGKAPKREKSPYRVSITTRIVEPVYERLAASAKSSGRSISEEIERRIEQSFLHEDIRETIREEMRGTLKQIPAEEMKAAFMAIPDDAQAYATQLRNLGTNKIYNMPQAQVLEGPVKWGPIIGKQPDCQ